MADADILCSKGAIRAALARDRYVRDEVRIADDDVQGYEWLVASHRGIFAVSHGHAKTVIHGWFFGICREGDTFFLFENCNAREPEGMGRIVRLQLTGGRLRSPAVIAKGLHNNCHQVRVIDGCVCVVDTASQAIRRFDPDGRPIDVRRPFPPAPITSDRGDYLHINSIAKIGERIGLMLHNGKVKPDKKSQIAWLGDDWEVDEIETVEGYACHDIVADETGRLWHSASISGELVASDGTRVRITDELMTRGIAITHDAMIVGISSFGPRQIRDGLSGGVVILDRQLRRRSELALPAGPTDVVSL
jgi:hypothetical protein